ncbi:unnamed protein product [Choristocarpus tenellus]
MVEKGQGGIPWQDLRYIFGEIMYGGHITDFWDRRVNTTYLENIFDDALLTGKELAPGFRAPEPEGMDHPTYAMYIERALPDESPSMFGMPPNAEVNHLTAAAEEMFAAFLRLEQGAGATGGTAGNGNSAGDDDDPTTAVANPGGGSVGYSTPESIVRDLLPIVPSAFDMHAIETQAKHGLESEQGPYMVVAVQECSRMNILLHQLKRSLAELVKGMNGQLNSTQAMEDLQQALSINQVVPRATSVSVPSALPMDTSMYFKIVYHA